VICQRYRSKQAGGRRFVSRGRDRVRREGQRRRCGRLFVDDVRSVIHCVTCDLLKTRLRTLRRTERTEFTPSSPNSSDGFRSPIAPEGGEMSMWYTQADMRSLSNVRIISKSPSRNSLKTLKRTPFNVSSAWGED